MEQVKQIIEKAGIQNYSLYGRTLEQHLTKSAALAEACGLSGHEQIVANLHSLYGDLFGYDARGLEFDQRSYVQTMLGAEIEYLIYVYNVAQPTRCLLEPNLFEDNQNTTILKTIEGNVEVTREQYRSIVNVYAIDILEQLYYLVGIAKICSFEDFKPHIDRFDSVKPWLRDNIRRRFDEAKFSTIDPETLESVTHDT